MPNNHQYPSFDINFAELDGRVVIQFSAPVQEVVLDVQDAAQFAHKLAEVTKEVALKHGQAFNNVRLDS
jgi:hypothetical protein